jgi:hypothetical protein
MKALTLHQPWATAIAEGIKTIETRSWSTSYRGPLAIHAGRSLEGIEMLDAGRLCREDDAALVAQLVEIGVRQWGDLPLGAIVAVVNLVDVVPIGETADDGDPFPRIVVIPKRPPLYRSTAPYPSLVLFRDPMAEGVDISEQQPWGDFTPGRFAWLSADVRKLDEPIPAKGRQGLWSPQPPLAHPPRPPPRTSRPIDARPPRGSRSSGPSSR